MAAVQTAFDFDATRSHAARRARGEDARASAQLDLQGMLQAAVDAPLRVTITDNRRTMISLRKRPGFTELRLHHMFLSAPESTVHALSAYVARSDRAASLELGRYIEQHRERIRRRVTRPLALCTRGTCHDLEAIYADINARYFQGSVDARITWGRQGSTDRRRKRSIKLGSYCSREKLIRVHPALDARHVPRYFVEYIVYHEMLHHVLPPVVRAGRRQLHDRRFKALERAFPDYERALAWERSHLDLLLTP